MQYFDPESFKDVEIAPGFTAHFVHTGNMTFSYWTIKAGAELPGHFHPHEQVVNMIEGKFELTVDAEAKILTPGAVVIVPPNVPHSGKAITDCRIIDVFHPVREDYRR
ncbi:MAG: cupin [Desulfobacteraceae bacterium IS3]|nr:MAG: cupin [Desulfobacteraceae bacterium IS3]